MTNEAEHVIEVENLTKRYGGLLAVNGISFTVRKGEVFAFLGPNGAGKTTTVEIIETIRTATSGNVRLLGMDVTKRKRDIVPRIGVLPQGFSSFDRITVRETLQYFSRLFCRGKTDIDGLIRSEAETRHRPPHRRSSTGIQLVRQDNGPGDPPVLLEALLPRENRYRRADRPREPQGQDPRAVPEPLWRLEAAPRNRDCAGERPRGRVPRRADDRARSRGKARGVGSSAGPEK